MKFLISISYDGTNYCGWQVQPNAISIQSLIEKALQTILREPIKLISASRTDAGVHALEQKAHFVANPIQNIPKLIYAVNSLLPQDIRILSIDPVPDDFHARYLARRKIYHYYLHTDLSINPFKRLYRTHVPYPFNQEILKQALHLFIGTLDFTSFANEAHSGSAAKNPIKTIYRIDVCEEQNGLRIEFEGNGFLYKMVRNMVGTALDAATGKMTLEEVKALFISKDRRLAGKTAPPEGLFLVQVIY